VAIRSGIAGQLGIAAETTWGTYAVADHWYEPDNESLNLNKARIEGKGLRANNRVLRSDRWASGKIDVSGDVQLAVLNKSFGLWFKHMLGASLITADGAGWKHTSTFGDPYGLGLTVQVGRPDGSGTVRPFSYTGCKVQQWDLSNAVDGTLDLKVTLDGQQETTAQTLAAASYAATTELFYFTQGAITVGGSSSYNIKQWNLSNQTGIKQDRYFINGLGTKSEQIINAWAQPSGALTAEFTDLTGYNLYVNGTVSALSFTYQTVTTYDTAKPYKIVITVPACRFDGTTPKLGGPDILEFMGNFKVLNDGVNSPITIDYYTSDATD
jgi:hypothetical protein